MPGFSSQLQVSHEQANWVLMLTVTSTDKGRKLGFHGFVDSAESFLEVFDDLARIKMIPPVPKEKLQFN